MVASITYNPAEAKAFPREEGIGSCEGTSGLLMLFCATAGAKIATARHGGPSLCD